MKNLIRKILKEQDELGWAEDSLKALNNELQEIARRTVEPFDGWSVNIDDVGMTFKNENIIHKRTKQVAEFFIPFDMTVDGLTGRFPVYYRNIDNELEHENNYNGRFVMTTDNVPYQMKKNGMTREEATEKVLNDINLLLINNWRYLRFLRDYKNR